MTWLNHLLFPFLNGHRDFYRVSWSRIVLIFSLVCYNFTAHGQQMIKGSVVDGTTLKPLAYVNIGIKTKNIGAVSLPDGSFSLQLLKQHLNDTLTFSLVGYKEANLPINQLTAATTLPIKLTQRILTLQEVRIVGRKPVEKKFGIKKRNLLLHFTDGMFQKQDIFEIGQVIKLGDHLAQITSVNLHINASRKDSASFRINFYQLKDDRPAGRLLEKSIIQRHPIKEGWLTFDLRSYQLYLKGNFLAAIELIPEQGSLPTAPIYYEIKLGGSSRSFYRRNSLGQWNTPPHHYCLYVTALVDKSTPVPAEDEETKPAFAFRSDFVNDTFQLFVRLPADYKKRTNSRFPVIYHLDGNAYFDHISSSVERLRRKNKLRMEPIVVGIGYRNAYIMDSLRVRDYTYPGALPSDSLPISGGAENFYQFIKHELIPEIEKRYRADPANRTLMGHSFGGYFTLWVLQKELRGSPVFNQFVAASPSITYHDNYLMRQFASNSGRPIDERAYKLFLSMGELELADDSSNVLSSFIKALKQNPSLQIQSKLYNQLEHMGTAVTSFEAGIEFILGIN